MHSTHGATPASEPVAAGQTSDDGPAAVPAEPAGAEPRDIRVQADRLDAVINLLGELVTAGASASLLARQSGQRPLVEANDQVGQLIEEIRNRTLKMRMVPIGDTFARLRRVVRDTATELGKDVQLELVGSDTELDKSMLERIADPLMQLVRNALDHGLEPPAGRRSAGKPPSGHLRLSACHESGHVLIRIDDDGRGFQRDAAPGLDSVEQAPTGGGQGAGLDEVRRRIDALRGTLSLQRTPGQGSRVEIRLPLTLAIIDGFLVGVGPSTFIFPQEAVVEVVENRPSLSELDAHGRGVLTLRGQVLPVISLRRLYALEAPPAGRSSVVVVQAGAQRYGVIVDQLLGQHQAVIKPLGRLFNSLRGISGSSILGNGEVALIFDATALCHVAADPPGTHPRRPTDPVTPTDTPLHPQAEGQAS